MTVNSTYMTLPADALNGLNLTDRDAFEAIQRLMVNDASALPGLKADSLLAFLEMYGDDDKAPPVSADINLLLYAPADMRTEELAVLIMSLSMRLPEGAQLHVVRDWHFCLYHSRWLLVTTQPGYVGQLQTALLDLIITDMDPLVQARKHLETQTLLTYRNQVITSLEQEITQLKQKTEVANGLKKPNS